jgi:hypothetical protein
MEIKIGKIKSISVGFGGYQGAMLGLSVELGGKSWGVCDFKGSWGPDISHSEHCKWTEESRREAHADTMTLIGKLLKDANKNCVTELQGVPVEVLLDRNTLNSWRILTEVI